MTTFELVLLIGVILVPFAALLFVLPKKRKKEEPKVEPKNEEPKNEVKPEPVKEKLKPFRNNEFSTSDFKTSF